MKKQFYNKGKYFLTMLALMISGYTMSQNCSAGFVYSVNPNGVVSFYDSSFVNGNITSATWMFGDGTTGTGTQVTHQYNTSGFITVCYFITTSTGCSDSTCQVITLNPCTLTATLVYDSLQQNLFAIASGGTPPYSYNWTNGQTLIGIFVPNPGMYCCNITDSNGCTYTACYLVGGSGCSASFITSIMGNVVVFGNNSQSFSSLLWNFGDGTTSAATSPTHTYAQAGTYYACLTAYDGTGAVCSQYCDTIVIVPQTGNTIICGNVFQDINANGFNDNEPGFGNSPVMIWGSGMQYTAMPDSNGNYSISVPPGTYNIVYCVQQPYSLTLPSDSGGCGFYQVTIAAGDTICGFNFGVSLNSSSIVGYVFADSNNNGTKDAGEPGIPYQPVQIGSLTAYTDLTGKYERYVPVGTYTVSYTPSGVYASYPLTTAGSNSVNVVGVGITYQGGDYGLNLPAGATNIAVNLLPHTTITPGFPAWYDIQVCNIGINPTGATVTMNYDPGLTYTFGSPVPASVNTSAHVITWNLPTMASGQCLYIQADFSASTSYQIGDATFEFCSAYPTSGTDIDLTNNTDTVHQIVTGSWDPNNKLSVQTNNNNPVQQIVSSVNANQEIEYTINFQNLGTAPAVNVVVVDNLSTDLVAGSYQLTGASHNVSVSRNGMNVIYNFQNIMLPDANSNEPMSHGFVSYKINAVNGLVAGTQISDFSKIYFDFNSPVTTNIAVVTMVNPTGINEQGEANLHSVYPNPVSDVATIQFTLGQNSLVGLELFDAAGRSTILMPEVMMQAGLHNTNLNANQLSEGLYLLKLNVNGKSSVMKVTVKH